jgi:hypothetical protein
MAAVATFRQRNQLIYAGKTHYLAFGSAGQTVMGHDFTGKKVEQAHVVFNVL